MKPHRKHRLPAYSRTLERFPNYCPIHLTAEWAVCRALGRQGVVCLCAPPEPGTRYNLSRLQGKETWIFWKAQPAAALDLARQAKAAGALNLLLLELPAGLCRPSSPSTICRKP